MKLAIGVMGASGGGLPHEIKQRAYRLGEAIADRDAILITGGCPGLPHEAVRGADRLIECYRTKHFRKPSCFYDGQGEG